MTWDIRDSDLHQVGVVMDGWDGWDLEKNVRIIDSNELNIMLQHENQHKSSGNDSFVFCSLIVMFSGQWKPVLKKGI